MSTEARRPDGHRVAASVGRDARLQRAWPRSTRSSRACSRAAARRADRRRRLLDRRHARAPRRAAAASTASRCCCRSAIRARGRRSGAGSPRSPATSSSIQDADLEYSPEELPELAELIVEGRADVVYGSRFLGRHRVFLFTHYLGQPRAHAADQRPLQHDADGHGDLLQGDAPRGAATALDLQSNGFGIEPEMTAKIFKRGLPGLRSPHHLRRPQLRGRQEDRLEGRRRRPLGPR